MVWKGFRWARHFIYLTYLPEGKYLITYLLYLFMPNSRRFLAGSFLIFFCPNNRNSSFEVLAERRRRVPTSKMKKKRKEIDAASSIFKSGANKKKPQGGGRGTEEGLKTSSMTTSLMIELCEQSKRLRRADRAEDDDQRVFRSLFSLESLGRKKYKKKKNNWRTDRSQGLRHPKLWVNLISNGIACYWIRISQFQPRLSNVNALR